MYRILMGVLALGAWWGAVSVGPQIDATRVARIRAGKLEFVPDGRQLRVAATGFEEVVADLLWVRTVLAFGEWTAGEARFSTEWLKRNIRAVTELDPKWRTAYFYGGITLRVVKDLDGSDEVFRRGAEALPDDPFFPFSIGMNAYLYRDDVEAAAEWVAKAAVLPGAPSWYPAAAAGMRHREGDTAAAIHYLEGVLASTSSKAVRRDTERKLAEVRHHQLVASWAEACAAWRTRNGRPLPAPEALRELGFSLPANPMGDAWVVGADGVVRGAAAEARRVEKARAAELLLLQARRR